MRILSILQTEKGGIAPMRLRVLYFVFVTLEATYILIFMKKGKMAELRITLAVEKRRERGDTVPAGQLSLYFLLI